MKEWIFCNGLKKNDTLWWEVFRIYYQNPELVRKIKKEDLKYLACCKHPDLIKYTLMDQLNKIRMFEDPIDLTINIFHIIVARHAKNAAILDYILNNMYRIKPRYMYFSL